MEEEPLGAPAASGRLADAGWPRLARRGGQPRRQRSPDHRGLAGREGTGPPRHPEGERRTPAPGDLRRRTRAGGGRRCDERRRPGRLPRAGRRLAGRSHPSRARQPLLLRHPPRRTSRSAGEGQPGAGPAGVQRPGLLPGRRRLAYQGEFEPAAEVREVPIPNALGFDEPIKSPGHVRFRFEGQEYRLLALDDTGDGRLFLVFGDKTNGRETYGGGRFLYTDPPRDGKVVLDFNRSYNPPCVFTPYATCPLPPRENRLPFRIAAGERSFAGHEAKP
jgi:hypothetical protein